MEQEDAATKELYKQLQEKGMLDLLNKHRGEEPVDELLQRFLRSRNMKIPTTLKMLVEDLQWREEKDVLKIRNSTASEMLHGESNPAGRDLHHKLFPHGMLGYDKEGRAIVYKWWSKPFNASTMEKEGGITLQDLINYNIWTMERTAAANKHKGQWVYIIDLQGLAMSNIASSRHVSYCRALADADAAHFPERLGRLFIINAPGVFAGFWRLVQSWLDQKTRDKIGLFSTPETWKPKVQEVMELTQLPKHLGGEVELSYLPHTLDPRPQPQPTQPSSAAQCAPEEASAEQEVE